MIVLVANLGSTSFKYKLYDMPSEQILATGDADRIGLGQSAWSVTVNGKEVEGVDDLMDHGDAIELHLKHLVELGALADVSQLEAIGFKAVHGGPISGAVVVDNQVIDTMQAFADVAPQHNPPYIAAMNAFRQRLASVPQVAAFETAYHQTIPMSRQVYGIPWQWTEQLGIRRYGFHGASHRYIATRMAEIDPSARRVISCHLGGSCSINAILDGKSVANSFGMTAQTGTFHASRVGDFDAFAILKLIKAGIDLDEIWHKLGKEGGLAGISGVSSDMREVKKAAADGNTQAQLAIDAFVETCRHYIGAFMPVLGGLDSLVFTAGIGQAESQIRTAICKNLEFAGIVLDEQKNLAADRKCETRIDANDSKVQIWILPTNEELIVARQVMEVLQNN